RSFRSPRRSAMRTDRLSSTFALFEIGMTALPRSASFRHNGVWLPHRLHRTRKLAMSLVPSFLDVLQPLAVVMTLPTFDSFRLILSGWVFAPRRTITGMLLAAGALGRKHHSAFHRVFSAARWSLDRLGLAVFDLLVPWLGERVFLAVDDTLARKRGLKVFGVGMHLDPIISSRGRKLVNWGHSWVVLGVLLRFPLWPERWFCLPVLFRLYLNQSAAARHRRVYRTRPELAIEMLQLLCKARN